MNSKSENVIEVVSSFSIDELLSFADAGDHDVYIDTTGEKPEIRFDERDLLEQIEHPHSLIIPSGQSLCSFRTTVNMFCDEYGIDISGSPSLSLREQGYYEAFCDFRNSVLERRFKRWCKENNLHITFEY